MYIRPTDIIQIGDPAVCEFIDKLVAFSPDNKRTVELRAFLPGNYFAYHKCKENMLAFVDELIMIHESIQVETAAELTKRNADEVCVQFSGTVFICKKEFSFNPKYSYFALEQDALYDANQIICHIQNNCSQKYVNTVLLELCENHVKDGYITGKDIQIILESISEVPTFLRNIESNHWSASIARMLSEVPAIQFTGGFASNCSYKKIQVSTLHYNENLVGIRMQLY